jgi:hypothetical protein
MKILRCKCRLARRWFQPGCDVHAITVDVIAVDDDVAEIDAKAKLDPGRFGCIGIALAHAALHVDRAADGIHHARKLDEDAVAGGLDHATAVFRNLRVDQLAAVGL